MAGKSRDLWMTAYTSNYICSVWMGFGQEGIEKKEKQPVVIKHILVSSTNFVKASTK